MKKSFYFSNQEVANLLNSVAAAYELKGENRFRIIAYDRAATSIATASSEIKDLWDQGKLDQIPGIGPNIASHLDELFRTGKVKHFEQTKKGLPPAMFKYMEIPGIGPKNAFKLAQTLKITTVDKAIEKLKQAAEKGKIRKIEGFGEQSEKDILKNLNRVKKDQGRMTLPTAYELAEKIIGYLNKQNIGERIDPLGSLRRQASTVGDVDLAVATNGPEKTLEVFVNMPGVKEIVAKGENTARVIFNNDRQVDLKTMPSPAYGALLQHYTGSKEHNIRLRELALKKGLSLSEYGIKKMENGKWNMEKFASEKEFYKRLGMEWIPPELREDQGEIEASLINKLPDLIEDGDIKGDLHMHSNIDIEGSHDAGVDSIEDMAKAAFDLGYEYIGVSEHNPSQAGHTDKQIIELLKRKQKRVEQLNYSSKHKLPIFVFNGLEIDIKPDGNIAIPEDGLQYLDYVIASIHSSFEMDKPSMTKRVLKALDCPKVRIFGHPTGRKLGSREEIDLDWEKIFEKCLKNNIWLEINAWPERLDLPDYLVREAVKRGVKIIINSDSHSKDQLSMIKYGVSVARRGWATKENIINCLSLKEFRREVSKYI